MKPANNWTPFTNLFKISYADVFNDVTPANMMDKITKISTTTLLIQSPVNGEMMLLHQISTVGADILNKVEEHFGIFGNYNPTTPMKFTSKR